MRSGWCSLLAVVGGVGLLGSEPALAADLAPPEIYQRTLKGTCWVLSGKGAAGTGWVVDRNKRHVITNYHVVEDRKDILVVFPAYAEGKVIPERDYYLKKARPVKGAVISSDPKRDLALIELASMPAGVTELLLARESPSPGDRIYTVGNPSASGSLWVYTKGDVRTEVFRGRLEFKEKAKDGGKAQVIEAQVFETQAPINPGDSGGPVVNDRAELVGVNSCISQGAQSVTVCIDVREVREFLRGTPGSSDPVVSKGPRPLAAELRNQASALLLKGDYRKAVEVLTEAIKLEPKDYYGYNERGVAQAWLKNDAEAVKDFSRALELYDQSPAIWRNRGSAYYRLGKYQEAIDDFTRAIALNDKYARAYKGRADAYAQLGKQKEAEADYRRAFALDPSLKQ
jgi:hypothetical protein